MILRKLYLYLIPLSLTSISTSAQQAPMNDFEIKPHICISEQNEACVTGLEFIWRLAEPQIACIRSPEQRLFCTKKQTGTHFEEVSLEKATNYTLYSPANSFPSLTRQVKVLYVGLDVRLIRNHPWSIF